MLNQYSITSYENIFSTILSLNYISLILCDEEIKLNNPKIESAINIPPLQDEAFSQKYFEKRIKNRTFVVQNLLSIGLNRILCYR